MTVFHNEVEVDKSENVSFVVTHDKDVYSVNLIFDEVRPEDSGEIVFNAVNKLGMDKCFVELNVESEKSLLYSYV